jgi:hypothetical protein
VDDLLHRREVLPDGLHVLYESGAPLPGRLGALAARTPFDEGPESGIVALLLQKHDRQDQAWVSFRALVVAVRPQAGPPGSGKS